MLETSTSAVVGDDRGHRFRPGGDGAGPESAAPLASARGGKGLDFPAPVRTASRRTRRSKRS